MMVEVDSGPSDRIKNKDLDGWLALDSMQYELNFSWTFISCDILIHIYLDICLFHTIRVY